MKKIIVKSKNGNFTEADAGRIMSDLLDHARYLAVSIGRHLGDREKYIEVKRFFAGIDADTLVFSIDFEDYKKYCAEVATWNVSEEDIEDHVEEIYANIALAMIEGSPIRKDQTRLIEAISGIEVSVVDDESETSKEFDSTPRFSEDVIEKFASEAEAISNPIELNRLFEEALREAISMERDSAQRILDAERKRHDQALESERERSAGIVRILGEQNESLIEYNKSLRNLLGIPVYRSRETRSHAVAKKNLRK